MASCHTHATTKLSSHRSHRNHRSFWRKIFSHRLHGCAQIRRVWHPAIPTQPTKLSSHRTLRSQTICGHLCASVEGSSTPEASVCSVISVGGLQCWCTSAWLVQQRLLHPLIEHLYSVKSVGEPYAAKPSVSIRGRLFSARNFCEFREFCGRTLRSLTICVHL